MKNAATKKRNNRIPGQAILEYAVVIGIVVVAFTVMRIYLQRGIQAAIKASADQLSSQKEAEEIIDLEKGGYLRNSISTVNAFSNRYVRTTELDDAYPGRETGTFINEHTNINATTLYEMGKVDE